ncbi:MAG: SRPBCC family protein [Actinomycetota bacterium]|nr:SRPBCC family protein [Actinomycetota bacterium]
MPRTRRSRTMEASAPEIWRVVGDPHHLPRWWPRIARVEGVDAKGFTQVFQTSKGKPLRVDYRMLEREEGEWARWAQMVQDTPFERFLRSAETEVRLDDAAAAGTTVTITVDQRPRGFSRFGGFLLRGGARKQLDDALAGLAELVEPRR